MESLSEAVARTRKVMESESKWAWFDVSRAKPIIALYVEGDENYRAVYFAQREKDYHFGMKVGDDIQDHYLIRDGFPCSHEMLSGSFHCVEVEPESMTPIAKYVFLRDTVSVERKYNSDGEMVQKNYLTTHQHIPNEYLSLADRAGIDRELLTGYAHKPYGKVLMIRIDDVQGS